MSHDESNVSSPLDLIGAWKERLALRGESLFGRLPGRDGSSSVAYKASAWCTRALRYSAAFLTELGLSEGDRVVVLSDDLAEMPILIHGLWLGRLVPVLIEPSSPEDVIVRIITDTKPSTVIFPPELSARIAGCISKTTGVGHWLVTGKGGGFGSSPLRRLDQVLASVAGQKFELSGDTTGESVGLIVQTGRGNRCAVFSQRALIACAKSWGSLLPPPVEDSDFLVVCLSPFHSFQSILLTLVCPLFFPIVPIFRKDFELSRFWEQIFADGASVVALSQGQLRAISRRARPKAWTPHPLLRLVMLGESLLSPDLIKRFAERFGVFLCSSYFMVEGGGLVAAFPPTAELEVLTEWMWDRDVPSAGFPVEGATVTIRDTTDIEVGDDVRGEICIEGPQTMSGYKGIGAGSAYFGPNNRLHTGDEGFFATDSLGRRHLCVTGRIGEMFVVQGRRINPAVVDNFLYSLRGVEFAHTVMLKDSTTGGVTLGSYIIPLRASHLTEEDVITEMRAHFNPSLCPTVVKCGRLPKDGGYPSPREVEKLLRA